MDDPMYDQSWNLINPTPPDPFGADAVEVERKRRVMGVLDGLRSANLLTLREWNSVAAAYRRVEELRSRPEATYAGQFDPIFQSLVPSSDASLRSVAELADAIWGTVRRARSEWDVRRLYPLWAEEVQSIFSAGAEHQWFEGARLLGVPDGG